MRKYILTLAQNYPLNTQSKQDIEMLLKNAIVLKCFPFLPRCGRKSPKGFLLFQTATEGQFYEIQ